MKYPIECAKYIYKYDKKQKKLRHHENIIMKQREKYIGVFFAKDYDDIVLIIHDPDLHNGQWSKKTWLAIQRKLGDYIIYCNDMYEFLEADGVHKKTIKRYRNYTLAASNFMEYIGAKLQDYGG